MIRYLKNVALVATLFASGPAYSATKDEVDRLYDAMRVEELMTILRDEGLAQSAEIREAMFPDRAGGWVAIASGIYNTRQMNATFRKSFGDALENDDITPLLAFFTSETGARVIELELSARTALLDPATEDAAIEAFDDLESANPDRVSRIEAFVEAGDLVELNVMGGLNSSLAFYNGLVDGGAFEMTEPEILNEVWAQEEDIRTEAAEWLFAYLALAYQPLEDGALSDYVDLSASEAGADLNRALFAGYDSVFTGISYALGHAASRFSLGEDI